MERKCCELAFLVIVLVLAGWSQDAVAESDSDATVLEAARKIMASAEYCGLVTLDTETRTEDVRLTAEGVVGGTPAYMAPEMAQGAEVDGRADIYSLGCVAYWLLTGQRVFHE